MLRNPEKVSIPPFRMGFCVGWMLHLKFRQFTSMSQLLFSIRPSHVSSVVFHQELKGSKDSLCCLSIQAALSTSTAFQTARNMLRAGQGPPQLFHFLDFPVEFKASLSVQLGRLCCRPPIHLSPRSVLFPTSPRSTGLFSAALQTNSATSDHKVVACMAGPTLTELLC